jgi:hypothetical protein
MKFFVFRVYVLCGILSLAVARAEEFADTTDGSSQESESGYTKEQFEEMKNSPDPQVRKFYKNLTEGRFSSSKKGDSRYSGHLELHDFDLDGISDHGHAGNDAEGGVEEAILGKSGTAGDEKRANALEEARKKKGTCITKITQAKQGNCNNISAAILDVGSAHEGPDSNDESHRVYIVSPEVQKKMTQAGENYFAKFKAEVLDLGKGDQERDYGNDALRSEAVWLYKQWQFKMESSWKTLRAARLAGFETDYRLDPAGREFMHRMGTLMGAKTSNKGIAEEIFLQSHVLSQEFCLPTPATLPTRTAWKSCSGFTGQNPPAHEKMSLRNILTKDMKNIPAGEVWPKVDERIRNILYDEAVKQARANTKNDADAQKQIANIARCMEPNTWCYRPKDESVAKKIKPWTPVNGDPGNTFDDTREGVFIRMSEASKLPLAKQRAYVEGSVDFAKKMSGGRDNPVYAEWIKYISKIEKDVNDIRAAAKKERLALEAAGGKSSGLLEKMYDPSTKTILEIYGINAANSTHSAGYGHGGATPAPAAVSGGPKQTLPGVDFQK